MARFEAETTIRRPADEIWAYAADIRRHPDWMAASDARLDRGTGQALGDRGRERVALGPLKLDIPFEVAEAVPGRKLTWRAVDNPSLDWDVTLELEPIDAASTKTTYRAAVGLRGRWRLIAPIVAMEGKSGVKKELERLKAIVEQQPATVHGTATT
jgi:uncharacterized protein YndB with AHSA1/START domain